MPTMPRRDPQQPHRAATPLELLFDLVSVIAIAAAAAGLHHALAEGHFADGILKFCGAFFAIWWAWMNFTWFASAYDSDDTVFRLLTMTLMAGALTMAAGVEAFFHATDLRMIVIGFVIMRLAMIAFWLRAARHDAAGRRTALWYAGGIFLAQLYWVSLLFIPVVSGPVFTGLFAVGIGIELCVPMLAERQGTTAWHRHHIVERYGLLNIIVLGETLLSGSLALNAVSNAASEQHFDMALVHIALASLVVLFSMWWLYFSREEHLRGRHLSLAFTWGYGHFVIYLAGAAVGAGFAVLVDVVSHRAHVSLLVGDYAVAIPVALYMLGLWFVRDRLVQIPVLPYLLPACAALVLLAPLIQGLETIAAVSVLSVYARSHFACRHQRETAA